MPDGFYVVAATSELSEGSQMYVELGGEEILLCQHGGEYFAIAYLCSHAEFTLEGGEMRNGCITCPYHGAEFRLHDGSVAAPPAFEPIRTYPVKVEGGTIAIAVSG
ncbi:MAG: Rieske 2Fe-2S domain-containing protein [Pseudomonadales bacterium]